MTIVLLPGQILVPGVGITGTPAPQALAVPFNIDVYSVDDFYNIAPGVSDTVSVTTTDPADTEPSSSALVQGHKTFQIIPLTLGTWVVNISGGPGTNVASSPYPVAPRITTVAGNGSSGSSGDGGPATNARLTNPASVLVDTAGNLFIADSGNAEVRKVNLSGIINTVAQNMTAAAGMARDGAGNLYIVAEMRHAVFRMAPDGSVSQIIGSGVRTGSIDGEGGNASDDLGDGKPALSCTLNFPTDVALNAAGDQYIADKNNHRVRKVDHATGIISTIAGTGVAGGAGDYGPATSAQLNRPTGLAFDIQGNLYITEEGGNRVRKVSPSGVIFTVAGTGSYGYSGDNGPADSAELASPFGIAIDGAGNLYIADTSNHRIRKVDRTGIITTVAGTGSAGYGGDGGASTAASLNTPMGVAVDCVGNMVIADTYNQRVRSMVVMNGVAAGRDSDGDGLSDCAELAGGTDPLNPDMDADGVLDSVDNCPFVPNPDQLNTDAKPIDNGPDVAGNDATVPNSDKLGDACDPDIDNDWMLNTGTNPALGTPGEDVGCGSGPTNPLLMDTDADRVVDGAECLLHSNPNNLLSKPSSSPANDTDGDGLPYSVEVLFGSDPNNRDTDGDGIEDGIEVKGWATSPTLKDTNNNGCDDNIEIADVNGDWKVSVGDTYIVIQAAAGAISYNADFDLNKDGKMSIGDQYLVAAQSGKSCTPP